MSLYLHRVLDSMISSAVVPVSARSRLMRWAGYQIGRRVEMYPGSRLRSKKIVIGDGVFVNFGLFYDGNAAVVVGDRVAFGPDVNLITAPHSIVPSTKRCTASPVEEAIVIEDGCWIAAGVTVLPGVTIRRGCVIGARAVVTSSTEPDGLYLGTPARRVRDLPVN